MEWRLGDSLGISVTDETLERATRVKRLIGRPQESAQPERKSTTRYGDEPQRWYYYQILYTLPVFIPNLTHYILISLF
ncbi:hypothetical protein [Lysinibacillus sp. TE18511]